MPKQQGEANKPHTQTDTYTLHASNAGKKRANMEYIH